MVVLGEPGSGKTVAATYLVRGLLELRRSLTDARYNAAPVPVRINTAGWDGKQDFIPWLVTRLRRDYRLPPKLGRAMVDNGLVLPVLDGLDEMDETNVATAGPRARALLDRLNEWSDRPVVVLCRSIEFGRLQQKGGDNGLHGANTINLDPFPAKKAARHLRNIQKKTGATAPAWGQFIAHLDNEADSPLSGCLQNPWMLGLTLTILRHSPRTATALLDCTSREAVREGLFAAQIPAAIAGSADIKQLRGYTSSQVEKWLRSLSRCLEKRRATPNRDGTAIRLDEIWEVNGNNGIRYAYTGIVGLVYVLTSGYTVALMGYDLVSMPTWVFGVGFIFLIGSTGDLDSPAKRVALTVPRRSRWAQAAVYSFLSLWVCGLYIWVAFG
ncbi:NACHT domain-containing protein, partial [Nocardia sp. NPDC003345]